MGYNYFELWDTKKREERKQYDRAYNKVDTFFEELYSHSLNDYNTSVIENQDLDYRAEQNSYALNVMEAIKDKSILLIEAGVGIGKSYGYLIPIFYTQENVEKFKKIVISTSSIALQQQLLKDIDRISKMLNIKIKSTIAKGISNYACLRKIESRVRSNYTSSAKKQQLENLLQKMQELETSDKESIKEFSEKIWQDVKLESRKYCSNCAYSKRCAFIKENEKIQESNIIITNHANFVRNMTDLELESQKNYSLQDADMFVIDEAHQLESTMRNLQIHQIQLPDILRILEQVKYFTNIKFHENSMISIDVEEEEKQYIEKLKHDIESLFSAIRNSSKRNFQKNKKETQSIVDCDRLSFQFNPSIQKLLTEILSGFQLLIEEIQKAETINGTMNKTKEFLKFQEIYNTFKDMAKFNQSDNIYWASFFKENLINLCYAPKEYYQVTEKLLKREVPVVYTSGTMVDNKGGYSYFSSTIGLTNTQNRRITTENKLLSPFDYKENTLCYHDPSMASPNNYSEYITELTLKIDELIRITHGKALILFTSKKCMRDVYESLPKEEYEFDLYLQNEINTNEVREAFTQNTNSCLFATGAFWEGIDIKGKSLSSVIITHLPFDVADAVMQYKASKYRDKKDQFYEVYIPSMLVKLEQAMGRLIRSNTDTGLISILDSRFHKYLNFVQKTTQFPNYTTDIQEVIQFTEEKILTDTLHPSGQIRK